VTDPTASTAPAVPPVEPGRVIASAADARYGYWLLNLIGSIQTNSAGAARIVVYDIGLTRDQRRLLDAIRNIEIRTVPPFVDHWAAGRGWKLWIWANLEASEVLWLDAGVTVLRDLAHVFDLIEADGYFAVSTGVPNERSMPSSWYSLYGLEPSFGKQLALTSGIFGFSRRSPVYEDVVLPAFRDAVEGRCLGFSAGELDRFNWGLDRIEEPIVHDCPNFRWDQSVFNARLYGAIAEPTVHDLDRYAGWRSRRDHPEQVLWNHRRRGDYAYFARADYTPRARMRAAALRWRLALPLYRWLLDPRVYGRKLRSLTTR
jgi:hypothetical protein